MRNVFLVNPSALKKVDYKIDGNTVTITSEGQTAVLVDNFLKYYYYNNGKLPMFEKYVIEKSNSILVFDKIAFFKSLTCQTLGSLVKLGFIDFVINEK
jgi:hypothetical protein